MKVITDTAANLGPEKARALGVEVVPFSITFMGKTYRDDTEISPEALYRLFSDNEGQFPTTSQPSVGDLVAFYQKYKGEEILSVQVSSGLSGTYSAAITAAQMVPDGRISVVDLEDPGPGAGMDGGGGGPGSQAGLERGPNAEGRAAAEGEFADPLHHRRPEVPHPWRAHQSPAKPGRFP